MKKAAFSLILAALIFAAGLVGFYIGRSANPTPVVVSRRPAQTSTVPTGTADPTETSVPGGTAGPTENSVPDWPININTATAEELQALPGIGPVLAQRIIEYREENGPFETISELTMVSGIGIGTLEELMDDITVGG